MDVEEKKAIWRNEQLEVAAKVEILPATPSAVVIETTRFKFLSLLLVDESEDKGNRTIYFGGVDVSFPIQEINCDAETTKTDPMSVVEEPPSVAVYVILEYPSGRVVYQDHEYFTLDIPYISSYLAFREVDAYVRLIRRQTGERPELTPRAILVDGNGRLHPRRAGIACFVGVRTGVPTVGVGKTVFCEGGLTKEGVLQDLDEALQTAINEFFVHEANTDDACGYNDVKAVLEHHQPSLIMLDKRGRMGDVLDKCDLTNTVEPLDRGELVRAMAPHCRGLAVPLKVVRGDGKDEVIAYALVGHGGRIQSKSSVSFCGTKNPIYVSVGHKLSLEECVRICVSFAFAKIPEPVRQADLIGRDLLRKKHRK